MKFKTEIWPIEKLIPYARNPRKNDEVVDQMCAGIREFGFRIPIVAKSNGDIIDGHLRYKAAQKLGIKEVPVAIADELSDTQVKAFRIWANKSATLADWDVQLLKLEIEDLKLENYDVDFTGFSKIEIDNILEGNPDVDLNYQDPIGSDKKQHLIKCPHCGAVFNPKDCKFDD